MQSLLTKAKVYCEKYGGKATLLKILDKLNREVKLLPYRISEVYITNTRITELKSRLNNKSIYVVIPNIDWDVPLYQRPHQIANTLSKYADSYVLFISDQYRYDRFAFEKEVSPNLSLYSLRMTNKLDLLLSDAKHVVVVMCWTRHAAMLENFKYDKLVYEYIDELELFYFYNKDMEEAHRNLLQKADLVTVTADKLYEKAIPYAKKMLLSLNACDYKFFHSSKDCTLDTALAEKAHEYSAVLGYYGCVASWFDYEVVKIVAEKCPNWLFIIIGFDFDGTLNQLEIEKHSNILYIPAQPYRELPKYLNGFDIALIPFLVNTITESTSPVKLFEYMAAGKPILASDMPECRKYRSVYRYSNADDFIVKAKKLLELKNDTKYTDILECEALDNTWDARIDAMLKTLEI